MKDLSRKYLSKAARAIGAAELLLKQGDAESAASRAYYAMFYTAQALLTGKGLTFRKHAGVHSAFGEHFVKTGKFDAAFHRWLLEAFSQRLQADYGIEIQLDSDDVLEVIDHVKKFLQKAEDYLQGP